MLSISNNPNFITFLGTSNAFSELGRFNSSVWLLNETLIDCGPTTPTAIKKLFIPLTNLKNIFITHLHGDHFGGLPFLFLDRAYLTTSNWKGKFFLYGPYSLEKRMLTLIQALYPSQQELFRDFYEFHPIQDHEKIFLPQYSVEAYKANHSEEALMYKFILNDSKKSIIFTGDNMLIEEQFNFFSNVDYLITECTTYSRNDGDHTTWKSIVDKLALFEQYKIKNIVLVHLGADVIKNTTNDLPQNFLIAYDGLKLTI